MTPYASLTYFGFLLYTALPAIALGLWGRLTRWSLLLFTFAMLALQYGLLLDLDSSTTPYHFLQLLLYALYEGVLIQLFSRKRLQLWLAVGLVLLPLVAVKLLPGGLFGFLGISYLTFRSLDLLFVLADGLVKQVSWGELWLYLLFFPTIASGPVDRFRRFAQDLRRERSRADRLQDLDGAIHRLFVGLLYKFILANLIKRFWLDPAAALHGLGGIVSYMYAYTFYLFFDFAGYSAFAIGVSYLFGIRTPENFDRPFLARNIREFWNRWHISLSFWFRDHVYMRFVMWATRRRLLANRHLIGYLGFLLSMGLMGIWHGLQLHYIAYGLYHAALLIGYDGLSRWNKRVKLWGERGLWPALSIFITFHLVCFGLLLFSGRLF